MGENISRGNGKMRRYLIFMNVKAEMNERTFYYFLN